MIYVGTGITENYYPKTERYNFFPTFNNLGDDNVKAFTILLDCSEKSARVLREAYPNILFIPMSMEEWLDPEPGNEGSFECLQYGAFLNPLLRDYDLEDNDYVMFIDSDITVQRKFTDEEIAKLSEGKVYVGINWHDKETLVEELQALGMLVPEVAISHAFPGYKEMLCFNTGVVGATVTQWRRLYARYVELAPMINKSLRHYAKMQWLMSWIMQNDKYAMVDRSQDWVQNVHTHGHNPFRDRRYLENNVQEKGGVWYRGMTPILFAHHMEDK